MRVRHLSQAHVLHHLAPYIQLALMPLALAVLALLVLVELRQVRHRVLD